MRRDRKCFALCLSQCEAYAFLLLTFILKQYRLIHTIEHYSTLKREEILSPATSWLNIADMIRSEINQSVTKGKPVIPLT